MKGIFVSVNIVELERTLISLFISVQIQLLFFLHFYKSLKTNSN
jgi:hypothetical protein